MSDTGSGVKKAIINGFASAFAWKTGQIAFDKIREAIRDRKHRKDANKPVKK